MSEDVTRKLRLEHSSLYVFGGEESYGYSGSDFVRDKDGNSATVMIAEVAAYAKAKEPLSSAFSTVSFRVRFLS